MWAVIMYEPPNRANYQHNICTAVCFEYLLAACTGAVQLSPFFFDILFDFGFNENNSGRIQQLLLITLKICAYMNLVLEYYCKL